MNAVLLSIGDEIVSGVTLDTNSAWLAQRLAEQGITVVQHHSIGDDRAAIARAFRTAMQDADFVFSTGGLGPTKDDLTREALADATGSALVQDDEAMGWLESWFEGRTMTASNLTQAVRPASMRCLRNSVGTAPALALFEGERVRLAALPGPPHEMRRVVEEHASVLFAGGGGAVVRRAEVPTFGLGESAVGERIADLMERGRSPAVGTTAYRGVVTCRVRAEAASASEADEQIAATKAIILDRLGEFVLRTAAPEGHPLAADALSLLRERSLSLCTVESCTGGMVGELLTGVPGSSDVYLGGWVTYDNAMKVGLVGVDAAAVAPGGPGAVSADVACMMARGGLERAGASMAVSVSGVAGPGGGTVEKPVGTVWIAIAGNGDAEARRFLFRGDRDGIRQWSAIAAIGLVRNTLLGVDSPLVGEVERSAGG